MYIIINKITQESAVIKEKTEVSSYINKSISTIYRNETKKIWETKEYIIYNPKTIILKSNRGGKRYKNDW